MFKTIDDFLNSITMYRLILYYVLGLIGVALVLSLLGIIPYSVLSITTSVLFIIIIGWATNNLFARVFRAPVNVESVYISAFILALIIPPATSTSGYIFLGWAALWTMASKFIFNIGKKHLFNPVAIAVVITALFINQSANWWVGTPTLLPFVIIGGLLIVRKIRRFDLVFSFVITAILTTMVLGIFGGQNLVSLFEKSFLTSPLLFFAFVMLTEPLTTPPTKTLQVFYGALVGFLTAPQIHLGSFYFTPELALVTGNVFSYLVSPKTKLVLYLKQKINTGLNLYDFIFTLPQKINYQPGQYMEFTLEHPVADNRGNRRYFTLASSPTEDNLRLGIKFYDPSSTIKK